LPRAFTFVTACPKELLAAWLARHALATFPRTSDTSGFVQAAALSSVQEDHVLKAIFLGVCVLVLAALAAAAAQGGGSTAAAQTTVKHQPLSLSERLERDLLVARKARSTIHFFETHRRLLHANERGVVARETLARARQGLARTTRQIRSLRYAIRLQRRHVAEAATPRQAICQVFAGYCRQALDVAWCESRLQTTAQNGEYLGLFQMGATPRRVFGHGPTAVAQAVAAHRYFLSSGMDWSPWSCKPRV
jgi:hypothetical protein